MIIIGLLFLVIFGPGKLPGMARDFGKFVNQARRYTDEFKSEDSPLPRIAVAASLNAATALTWNRVSLVESYAAI